MTPIGSTSTRLLILRGNSGSGKSTIARELRRAYGRGLALVEQDYLRRVLLRDRDLPGAPNIGLIDQTVRYALNHDFHVVLEGILYADRYSDMLQGLQRDHLGMTRFYYFDLDFAETTRRHALRPQASEFGVEDMRAWYRARDLLTFTNERLLDATLSVGEVTQLLLQDAGLSSSESRNDA